MSVVAAGPGAIGAWRLLVEIEEAPAPPSRARAARGRPRLWRVAILVLALLFFLTPIVASIKYSLLQANGNYGFDNYAQIITNSDLRNALFTSLEIAGISAISGGRADAADRRARAAEAARLTLLMEASRSCRSWCRRS